MKLVDLNPRWYVLEDGGPRVGLTFLCPHCRTTRLGVSFHHAGREAVEDEYIHAHSSATEHIWQEDGESFDKVSLFPSVDASASGHWHGFVTNGEVN
jgi:hypothetical protein